LEATFSLSIGNDGHTALFCGLLVNEKSFLIVIVALGGLSVDYPAAGIISIMAVSGWAFIIGGVLNVYLAFRLKSIKTEVGRIKNFAG
jgi:hypothetical protein